MSRGQITKLIGLPIEKDHRCLRTANVNFSKKQKQFLARIRQSMCDSDGFGGDDSPIYIDGNDRTDSDFELHSNRKKLPRTSGMFCWICHKDVKLHVRLLCTTCIRTYHYHCAKVMQVDSDEKYRCAECVELEAAKKYEPGQFNRMLKLVMDKVDDAIRTKQKFQRLIPKSEYPKHLKYRIDLREILRNIRTKKYISGKAFLMDVAWMAHIYSAYFCTRKESIQDVRHLYKFCKDEVCNIETCVECFQKSSSQPGSNWFTKVCTTPHLLIWAKLGGYPYWPAKVMSVYDNVLHVRFFGEHERAFVPAKDCFLYSREDPNPVEPKTFRQQSFFNCVIEATEYVKNISTKFGEFYYAEPQTPFDPNLLEKYVLDMIGGYDTYQDNIVSAARIYRASALSSATNASSNAVTANERHLAERPNITTGRPMVTDAEATSHEEDGRKRKRPAANTLTPPLHYSVKYSKIIENPGVVYLERCDQNGSPWLHYITCDSNNSVDLDTDESQIEDTFRNFIMPLADVAPESSGVDAAGNLLPFSKPTRDYNRAHTAMTSSIFDAITSTTSNSASQNSVQGNRRDLLVQPAVSGRSATTRPKDIQLDAAQQAKLFAEMSTHLIGMVKECKVKVDLLHSDFNAIAKYADEMSKLKASHTQTTADTNTHCVNCGESARIFTSYSWSTGYCGIPCREQYRSRYGDIPNVNQARNVSKEGETR